MKTNLHRAAASSVRCSLRPLAIALAALSTSLAALLLAPSAQAGAVPFTSENEADPFDAFSDRAVGELPAHDAPARALAVGIDASLRLSSDGASSFGALAFFQIPFERLLTPPRRALTGLPIAQPPRAARAAPTSSTASPPPPPSPAARAAPPSPASARAVTTSPLPASSGRSAASSASSSSASSSSASSSFTPIAFPSAASSAASSASTSTSSSSSAAAALDPSAPETPARPAVLLTSELARGAVRAACKSARLDEADARLDSLTARARTSALLPELRLRATRVIDENESLAPTEYDPTRRTASGGATTWLEARATFRLDRLVFADDEIAVERLRLARVAERTRLVTKVLDLLDEWQRARSTEVDDGAKPDAQIRAALTVATSEATLDVLTNGWFSKATAHSGELRDSLEASPAREVERADDAAHPSLASAPAALSPRADQP